MKLAAGCLSDDVTTKYSTAESIYELAKAGTVVNDIESVELLEWASGGLIPQSDFSKVFGPMRSKTAKAKAKGWYDGGKLFGDMYIALGFA